jgi:hypothetical protein
MNIFKSNQRCVAKDESGVGIITFAIAFPIVLLFGLMIIDIARYVTTTGLLTKACLRGVSTGAGKQPVFVQDSGSPNVSNIYQNRTSQQAISFYNNWKTEWCVKRNISPCPDFSLVDTLAMASAAQQIIATKESIILPKKDCDKNELCAFVVPESFPTTTQDGIVKLRCSMNIELFSTPILRLFAEDPSSATRISKVAQYTLENNPF